MTLAIILTAAMLAAGLAGEILIRLRIRRVGGIHFWRIGRIGGSLYFTRNRGN